jgi:hypothetical protein
MATQAAEHPITLRVDDDLSRNRLTVFFRLILAIPHFVVVALWGVVFFLLGFVSWLVALFTGSLPEGLHGFQASYVRYANRVNAYLYLVADPYPPFGAGGTYPVDLEIAGPERQSRLTVFFRLILALPAWILASLLMQLAQILGFIAWFVCLFTGKMPQGMRDLSAFCLRYYSQTFGYAFLLTQRYPSLSGGPTA